jgi:rubrerythrin
MSLRQRLDRLAKAPSVANCRVCAFWNPIRVFKLKDADDKPPAWPGPDDPRQCPRCGAPRKFVNMLLYPHAHPAGLIRADRATEDRGTL